MIEKQRRRSKPQIIRPSYWLSLTNLVCVIPLTFAFVSAAGACTLEDPIYACLKRNFPEVRRYIGDQARAFDPKTGRNFAWDEAKRGWIVPIARLGATQAVLAEQAG